MSSTSSAARATVVRVLTRFLALIVVVAAVAGCGGGHQQRDAVDQYVREVNTIQAQMRGPLAEVAQSTRTFKATPAELSRSRPRLVRAERTLTRLERRLKRLDPPADAERLHARLLRLVSAEVALTHELRRIAEVFPRLDAQSTAVSAAGKRLRTDLDAATTGVAQAAALERYGRTLGPPLVALRALQPPPLLARVRGTQVTALTRLRSSAAGLARALRQRREAEVRTLVRRFALAARTGDTVAAQRAQIAAIKAYNARARRISQLAAEVQRERDRLERVLP